MAHYGGFGGAWNTPERDPLDLFEEAIAQSLGEQMKADREVCTEVWCALSNQCWKKEPDDFAAYSWRSAGDLIAAVTGKGIYLDFYGSGTAGSVSDRVRDALEKHGWRPCSYDEVLPEQATEVPA
jgi:hypothetical protein